MSLFDINGNVVSSGGNGEVSEALVRQAIINGVVSGEIELPTTTTSGTLSISSLITNYTDWMAGVQTAYESMIADYKSDAVDGIPLFIGTDLHGTAFDVFRIAHNTDKAVMALAMGDICTDYFNLGQIASIKTSFSPVSNIIAVVGNHDVWTKAGSDAHSTYHALRDAFHATDPLYPDNRLYFSMVDNRHNVKYIVLSPYNIIADNWDGTNSVNHRIETEQMAWLIRELSKNDGHDIVILSHEPMTNTMTMRDGTTEDWQTAANSFAGVMEVLTARKNKTSGTITDVMGASHSYNFGECASDLLCSFHGHLHTERYSTEGITQYIERSYSTNVNGCVSWALIDRNALTLTIYKAGYDNLVIPL